MDTERAALLAELDRLRERTQASDAEFMACYEQDVDSYRRLITTGVEDLLAEVRGTMLDVSDGNPVCDQLASQVAEYVGWLQWCLWDLPYFAIAMRPSPEQFSRAAATCGLVYLSARVFDDVIDRHFWYKGKHPSLLAQATETFAGDETAEGLAVLAGLLLLTEGLIRLADPAEAALAGRLPLILDSIRRAVIGLIMEHSRPEDWNRSYYDRLVQLKNVDYWRTLYAALDPERCSPLYPFLERYYTLAQHLNDVQDHAEDEARGQPNLISLYLPSDDATPAPPASAVPPEVERSLADTFLQLGATAEALPNPERLIAELKLGESLHEAYRLGLFAVPGTQPRDDGPHVTDATGIHWLSSLQDIIEHMGSQALVRTDCPVCDSGDRNFLFRKQGFAFHRCRACSHIYVTPRISAELQGRVAAEWDSEETESSYLAVQRIFAAATCQLLRSRAPGNRLLDIGFGHGHLMDLARAYGFEVFGIESSRAKVERLGLRFGQRIAQLAAGEDPIPWAPFDVVVMSHVLEHVGDPRDLVRQVRQVMNPRAVLYVAVPDMEALTFKILGKKWEVISPLVHLQYFDQASLTRLLEDCGLRDIERVEPPPLPDRVASRWARLLARLSGSDSSELIVLARVSED